MSAVKARIVNTDHDGNTLTVMEDLPAITYTFVRSDVGSASWEVPFSHPYLQRANSGAAGESPQGFGPKLTDFRIGITRDNGASWQAKFGGICGPVGLDSDRSSVAVSGVDWLAWLDQPYRFNAYYDLANATADDIAKVWVNQLQQTVIQDLVNNLDDITFTFDFLGTWVDVPISKVMYGDTGSVLDTIKGIGAYSNPYGFEFYCDWNKLLTFCAPRRSPAGTAGTDSIYDFTPDNIVRIQWGNNGPIESTGIGEQFGLWWLSDAPAVAAKYRDWWTTYSFSEWTFKELAEVDKLLFLQRKTEFIANHDRNPQRNIVLTLQPELVTDPDWFLNQCGQIVHVDSGNWFAPYWRINSYHWIQQQVLKADDAGNWTCELTLEQIYD